jgi:hypothetical protein
MPRLHEQYAAGRMKRESMKNISIDQIVEACPPIWPAAITPA